MQKQPNITATVRNRLSLLAHLRLVTIAGALAMVYAACTSSPLCTDYVRGLGATEFHFGLLGGVPMIMISMQFFGAYLSGRLRTRKAWFMALVIVSRVMYVPAVLLPLLFPQAPRITWVYLFLACMTLEVSLGHFATPLWLSWMGDLIPPRILNRYWAERHRVLQLIWTMSYLAVAAVSLYTDHIPTGITYPILACLGAIAGVADIILFTWVGEPENVLAGSRNPLKLIAEPLRHREYRTFVAFTCAFSAAAMLAAVFMQIYVLKILGLPRWKVILIWCMIGIGGAVGARTSGRIADRFGHRPLLLLCMALKPFLCLVFMLITSANAFPVLVVTLFFDGILNSAYFIAVNGYRLKMAPRENRSMFIAATIALSGMAGGLAAIGGGWLLRLTEGMTFTFAGRTWINYHLLFLISMIARALCIKAAADIKEPASASHVVVLAHLRGLWPMRMRVFPVGLYRRLTTSRPDRFP